MTADEHRRLFASLAEMVFELAGDYDAEVLYTASGEALTRFANNTIHQNLSRDTVGLTIRLQRGERTGAISLSFPPDEASLTRAVDEAKRITDLSAPNAQLLPMLSEASYRSVEGFCPKTAALSPGDRAAVVASAVDACEKEGLAAAGIVENGANAIGIANSKGLFAFWAGTNFAFSLTVEGADGTGWSEALGWSVDDVSVDDTVAEAIEIALRNQNPRDVEPGRYTVVLPPAAVGELLAFVAIHGFNARAHLERRSFLAGKLGKKVFSDRLTIVDDAYDPRWRGLPFDFEGVPRKRVELVREGVLVGLVYDRWTAEKMGEEPTGHGLQQPNQWGAIPLNLIVHPGDATVEEMIKETKRGLLVTHFHYTNVSELARLTLTGMTRDGLFMIEDGEIAYPVKNLRFTQSVEEAFNNIVAVGKEQKRVSGFFFGGAIAPAMMIEGFEFSSKTEFGG